VFQRFQGKSFPWVKALAYKFAVLLAHETYNSWETLVSVQTKVFSRRTGPPGNREGATGARVLDLWKAAWDGLIWKATIPKVKAIEGELNRNPRSFKAERSQ